VQSVRRPAPPAVIVLGVILILVGYLTGLGLLETIGLILLVVGVILWIAGGVGHPVAGRRFWW
jgi:hypothetical protein